MRRLDGGRVELRHLQWAEGLGWYGTQRIVLEAEALADLRRALDDALADPRPEAARAAGTVTSLDAWRTRRR